MAGIERTLLLVMSMVVSLLSNEYCSEIKVLQLSWPKTSLGLNVTKDCSAINASWTGKFTAKCRKNLQGNATWNLKEGCGCEVQSVLLYHETKVSQVNEGNFLDTAHELQTSFKNFTNEKTYLNLLSRLKASICKKTSKLKNVQWDKIQNYCQTHPSDFEKEIWRRHFETYFCQSVGSKNPWLGNGVVLPSFGGSRPIPNAGIAVQPILRGNLSQRVNNTLASVNSSGCTVTSYRVTKGTITIKAKRNTADAASRERHLERRALLELVLISVSLVAITFSLIMLSCVRTHSPQTQEKLFIHKNFLLSWGLGYAVYIVDVAAFNTRNERTILCTTIAVVLHFFHTTIFTWMLVEAVNLYIKLVKVISTRTFYITYLAIGWGIPAIIVGMTAAVRARTYDMSEPFVGEFMCGSQKFTAEVNRTSCWINGSNWIYRGPVLAILLVNLIIFFMLLKVVFGKLGSKFHDDRIMKTKKGLKSVAALLPLLGVTWIFGFFVNLHEVLDYIFILLTSTQGIVFCVFHCILDGQVRKELSQRFKTSHINKSISILGKRGRKEYTVNRNGDKELERKQMTNEANKTFNEIERDRMLQANSHPSYIQSTQSSS